jgi:hypothetical protein
MQAHADAKARLLEECGFLLRRSGLQMSASGRALSVAEVDAQSSKTDLSTSDRLRLKIGLAKSG